MTRTVFPALVLVSTLVVGCNRGEQEVPPAQTQTQQSHTLNTPTTLTGCLRAGDAADTYVLTTSLPEDGTKTATYQLIGSGGVNLQDHVGASVQVTGVIREQEHIATRETPQPAGQQPKGTTGTPTVQTSTELAVRSLDVNAVNRVSDRCD